MCCPLSSCDEYATVYDVEWRVSRKEHKCEECREPIPARTKYQHISMLFDGSWSRFKLCAMCTEIGDHFDCGGRSIGMLWEELEENFFPDMKAGGPCMVGLSPAARQHLIDKRMEWFFGLDEIPCHLDDVWEGWTPDKPPSARHWSAGSPYDARTVQMDDDDHDPAGGGW